MSPDTSSPVVSQETVPISIPTLYCPHAQPGRDMSARTEHLSTTGALQPLFLKGGGGGERHSAQITACLLQLG